ncbi:MAG: 50S ribosomal protein L10 [Parcubacteria group bacterium SW_6_46_9]|nr:MAG: 50S ribosomal protein L10 [Parcubacteria group bacterium SW_6_46_9]
MALTRPEKKEILDELADTFADVETVTFVRFDGLNVDRMEQLRTALREEDVQLQVVKKTLLNLTLDDVDVDGDRPELPGKIAFAYGGDVTAPARSVYQFETDEEAGETLEIVGGIFEGRYRDKEAMNEIAQIPGADELRGMFVNAIASPLNGFAVTLNERAKQLE